MPQTAKITIKVVPNSSQNKIMGWLGDALKVRVCAQPEKGKANIAVITLLAKFLQIPTSSISVISGKTSQLKIIEIQGFSIIDIKNRLNLT